MKVRDERTPAPVVPIDEQLKEIWEGAGWEWPSPEAEPRDEPGTGPEEAAPEEAAPAELASHDVGVTWVLPDTEPIVLSAPVELEEEAEVEEGEARAEGEEGWSAGSGVRRPRRAYLAALAGLLLTGAAIGLIRGLVGSGSGSDPGRGAGGVASSQQQVVAWSVWQDEPPGPAFVAVLASGGGRDPVVLGVPGHAAVEIPGHGFGLIDFAARGGDPALVAAAAENALGVQIDDAAGTTLAEFGGLVDRLGGVEIDGRMRRGEQVVAYLRAGSGRTDPTIRFSRWMEVLNGVVLAAGRGPDILSGFPEELRGVLSAAASVAAPVLDLPVEDIGAGLVRPDAVAVSELVRELFVVAGVSGHEIRLVVLNGQGTPGIGEEVARILVPHGFKLVSSQNMDSFGEERTRIVAGAEEFLDAARRARELLGVGRVFLDAQRSSVADVTIIVGHDFAG